MFIRFNKNFEPEKQVMQLADGSRQTRNVLGKSDASVMLQDINGNQKEMVMEDALYYCSSPIFLFFLQPTSFGTTRESRILGWGKQI